jgi:hypothetical protein
MSAAMQFSNRGVRQPGLSARMRADQPDHARRSAKPDEFVHPRTAITRPGGWECAAPGSAWCSALLADNRAERWRRCAKGGRSSSRRQTSASRADVGPVIGRMATPSRENCSVAGSDQTPAVSAATVRRSGFPPPHPNGGHRPVSDAHSSPTGMISWERCLEGRGVHSGTGGWM